MWLPEKISRRIGTRAMQKDLVGMSEAQVYVLEDMVLKIGPWEEEAQMETTMLAWLEGKLPVPRVLEQEQVGKTRYLLMERLPGKMACDPAFLQTPNQLVDLLAQGLRMLQQVDVRDCPVDQRLNKKLLRARARVAQGLVDLGNVEPETFGEGGFSSPAHLLTWLEAHRPEEQPVLSHGDYCLPNVFFQDGGVSGFLDLGRCGIADPYQDIALCYRSLRDNFNGSHGYLDASFDPAVLFEALELEPDWEKIRYYILLDELF